MAGVIMGTAAYMSPEQARGQAVDKRADIWAFGVVLHELLSGRTLFQGDTVSDTLAAVLRQDPDLALVPARFQRLLRLCLARDPRQRLRDISGARLLLDEPTPVTSRARVNWLGLCAAGLILLATGAGIAWMLKPTPSRPVTRFPIVLGDGQRFTSPNRLLFDISPDGTQMAYAANGRLYLRSMAELTAQPIPGTESGGSVSDPMFSPDGKALAYFDDENLKRIAVSGGTAVTLCRVTRPYRGSWGESGIVFGDTSKGIQRVSPNGGEPEVLVPSKGQELMGAPRMLPGNRAVLFSLSTATGISQDTWDKAVEVVVDLNNGVRKPLGLSGMGARYLPTGHLVYGSGGILYAVRFNARSLEVTGKPMALIEGVARAFGSLQIAISESGSMAYIPGSVYAPGSRRVLASVTFQGEVEPLNIPPAGYEYPRASKDGKWVAYQIGEPKETGIWIWKLDGSSAPRRLTLPGTGENQFPVWSADSQWVAFQSNREGDLAIWWQRADGSGAAERLTRPGAGIAHVPDSWSSDGQTLSFTQQSGNSAEVWTLSLREKKTTLFASVPGALVGCSVFSPDGRWIAYQVFDRIYVRPFPPTAAAYMAPSQGDAHHPAWSVDGKSIFYVAGAMQAGSTGFTAQPSVAFGTPLPAHQSGFGTLPPSGIRPYDVLADGKHFIGLVSSDRNPSGARASQEIQVVLNWLEEIKERLP